METFREILSYTVIGTILLTALIPLIGLLILNSNEKKHKAELKNQKKVGNKIEPNELIHT